MTTGLLAIAGVQAPDMPSVPDPALRRASAHSRLAVRSVQRVLSLLDESSVDLTQWALVLGTAHGELTTTTEFLATLAEQKVARPILFQNSLHNSTAGVLAMHFGIRGPAVTVSRGAWSGEDALELASDWVRWGKARHVLVVGVDTLSNHLEAPFRALYPPLWPLGDIAGAAVVVPEAEARWLVRRESNARALDQGLPRGDADLIFQMSHWIANAPEGSAQLGKPDGSSSHWAWQKR